MKTFRCLFQAVVLLCYLLLISIQAKAQDSLVDDSWERIPSPGLIEEVWTDMRPMNSAAAYYLDEVWTDMRPFNSALTKEVQTAKADMTQLFRLNFYRAEDKGIDVSFPSGGAVETPTTSSSDHIDKNLEQSKVYFQIRKQPKFNLRYLIHYKRQKIIFTGALINDGTTIEGEFVTSNSGSGRMRFVREK